MAQVRYADMKHKVALVTGAASGIGEACARQFAAQDCRVVMVDRNAERLQALLGELSRSGKTACTVVGDVTEEATSVAGVDRCQSAYGRIDYAVNCAGVVGASASIDQTQLEEWERVLAINLKSTREAGNGQTPRRGGEGKRPDTNKARPEVRDGRRSSAACAPRSARRSARRA